MRSLLMAIAAILLFMPALVHAQSEEESDGVFRAEILGEYGGEAIAKEHTEYDSEKAKEECKALFESKWRAHFDEMGFGSGPEVVDAYVASCMKGYNEKSGK